MFAFRYRRYFKYRHRAWSSTVDTYPAGFSLAFRGGGDAALHSICIRSLSLDGVTLPCLFWPWASFGTASYLPDSSPAACPVRVLTRPSIVRSEVPLTRENLSKGEFVRCATLTDISHPITQRPLVYGVRYGWWQLTRACLPIFKWTLPGAHCPAMSGSPTSGRPGDHGGGAAGGCLGGLGNVTRPMRQLAQKSTRTVSGGCSFPICDDLRSPRRCAWLNHAVGKPCGVWPRLEVPGAKVGR